MTEIVNDDVYNFDRDGAKRVVDAVRKIEDLDGTVPARGRTATIQNGFWAKITGFNSTTKTYSWIAEQGNSPSYGLFATFTDQSTWGTGTTSTNFAKEVNDTPTPTGTIVFMRSIVTYPYLVFAYNAGGSTSPALFYNNGDSTIPNGGAFISTGITTIDGENYLMAEQLSNTMPGSGAPPWLIYGINTGDAVEEEDTGECACDGYYSDWGILALWDTDDDEPVAGETWGPIAGQYALVRDMPGFQVLGIPDTSSWSGPTNYMIVRPQSMDGVCVLINESDSGDSFYVTPTTIPSYAVCWSQSNNVFQESGECFYFYARQFSATVQGLCLPQNDKQSSRCIIANSRMEIPEDGWGIGFYKPPFKLQIDTTTIPSGTGTSSKAYAGQQWGPVGGSWLLTYGSAGFNCIGSNNLIDDNDDDSITLGLFEKSNPQPGYYCATWSATFAGVNGDPTALALPATSAGSYSQNGAYNPIVLSGTSASGSSGTGTWVFQQYGMYQINIQGTILSFTNNATGAPVQVPTTTYGLPTTNQTNGNLLPALVVCSTNVDFTIGGTTLSATGARVGSSVDGCAIYVGGTSGGAYYNAGTFAGSCVAFAGPGDYLQAKTMSYQGLPTANINNACNALVSLTVTVIKLG